MRQVRQGDVFLAPIAAVPFDTVTPVPLDAGRVILAYGEVTGHAHAIAHDADTETLGMPPAQLFEAPDGTRYLLVDRPTALVHEEHGRIALEPGAYQVVRQREYAPEGLRQVAD